MRRIAMSLMGFWVLLPCGATDYSTTNRESLGHFWQAAEEKVRPVTVISFGDSMAESVRTASYYLMQKFEARLGVAGYSLNNYRNHTMYQLTNGASVLSPSSIWFGAHLALPPAAGIWYETQFSPGGILSDQVGVFYVSHPQGGIFTLSVSTNGGPWAEKLVLDGYSPTPLGHYTNVALAREFHRLRLDGITGTNIIIGPQLLAHTNGAHIVFMDRYGISLAEVTNVPLAIREPIFAALKPDLLIWHMKEDGSPITSNRMEECESWWSNAAPDADVLYIGTPWTVLDNTSTLTLDQNLLVRTLALEHQRTYVDLMEASVSYNWLVTNFFLLADGLHLSDAGGQWGATVMWNDLDFFALGLPRTLNLQPTNGLMRLGFPTAAGAVYGLFSSSNLVDWIPLLSTTGNGNVQITNIMPSGPETFYRLSLTPN